MSEQDIQRQIISFLRRNGAHVTKYIAGAYGASGEPDLSVSLISPNLPFPVGFYVEVKTRTGKLSLIQQIRISQMQGDGHWVCVARCVNDVHAFLLGKGILLDF